MFIAQGTTHLALRRSAMSSAETSNKTQHRRLHGTPTQRNLVGAFGYKHCTPPE